jgi:drug/metabolite transporter (DMT)-like permease
MVYVLALGAAFANALTSVLQRMGVEDAPADSTLHLRLISFAVRRKVWLLGFAFMVVSFVMQAIALHYGRLTEVQPILTTELLFLVIILATWFRYRVGWREWSGAALGGAGLAGFLIFANPEGGNAVPLTEDWLEVGSACVGSMALAVVLALRGPRWWRAIMFGAAAAIGYAFTAALTKVVTGYISQDWVSMFVHWETYALALFGLMSVFLAQNAFHAGPIAASQSTLVLVDPLASILIGIGLFNDQLRTAPPWGPLEALSLLVLFLGMLILCNSPLVAGVKGEQGEYLRPRARRGFEPAVDAASGP